jgi:tripeptide aminopeptidase
VKEERFLKTLYEILAFDAPSGQEENVANYCFSQLQILGCEVKKDAKGNVIGFITGVGTPLLLTAHMDRVPPGKGHTPVRDGDILKSDGTTNLGTDDAAGIAIILEAVASIQDQHLEHPPLVIVFTVGEEIGLQGARAVDLSAYQVTQGIGFDNAYEAGVLISEGATYEGFDIEIHGKDAHPGKDIGKGINALQIFLETDWMLGETEDKKSRINFGLVTSGTARNVVPGNIKILGELRTTLPDEGVKEIIHILEENLKKTCSKYSASYTFTTNRHSSAYTVDVSEPLVQKYKQVVKARGGQFIAKPTFVGSDANVFRAEKGMHVFTLSTGVIDEHTINEWVRLPDLYMLTKDLIKLLTNNH